MHHPRPSTMRRALLASLAFAACSLQPGLGHAADWPSKPIQLVIPYPPGGSADLLALCYLLHFFKTEVLEDV